MLEEMLLVFYNAMYVARLLTSPRAHRSLKEKGLSRVCHSFSKILTLILILRIKILDVIAFKRLILYILYEFDSLIV